MIGEIVCNEKKWRNLWVDRGMKTSWLERLNAVKTIKINGTCSGHSKRRGLGKPPAWVSYRVPSDRHVVLALCHIGNIARVESFGGDGRTYVGLVKPPAGGGFKYLSKSKWWGKVIGWLEFWYSSTK